MVMRPEPWGEALDAGGGRRATPGTRRRPHLIVPGPGGVPFTQAMARELAGEPWLAFACGRYEGIDERVHDEARERMPVSVVSLGDYVLNGGEVAVLAMVEAVARLHARRHRQRRVAGRGVARGRPAGVPGLHQAARSGAGAASRRCCSRATTARIARWRRDERLRRTALRRPDLIGRLDPASLDARDREVLEQARLPGSRPGRFAGPAVAD